MGQDGASAEVQQWTSRCSFGLPPTHIPTRDWEIKSINIQIKAEGQPRLVAKDINVVLDENQTIYLRNIIPNIIVLVKMLRIH